jgi:rhodanese-related sulfurtransferase
MMSQAPDIGPEQLREALASADPPAILDVRESEELEISSLPGSVNVPLRELPSRLSELDRDRGWVVVCRSGARSAHATAFLQASGFREVRNLAGGLNGYARLVDRSMRVY